MYYPNPKMIFGAITAIFLLTAVGTLAQSSGQYIDKNSLQWLTEFSETRDYGAANPAVAHQAAGLGLVAGKLVVPTTQGAVYIFDTTGRQLEARHGGAGQPRRQNLQILPDGTMVGVSIADNIQGGLLAKFDQTGRMIWSKDAGFSQGSVPGVGYDFEGNVYAVGVTRGQQDALVVKYTSAGALVWKRSLKQTNFRVTDTNRDGTQAQWQGITANAVAVDLSGNVYVGGGAQTEGTYNGKGLAFLYKFNANGELHWLKTYEVGEQGGFRRLIMAPGNKLIGVGNRKAGLGIWQRWFGADRRDNIDALIMAINTDTGERMWQDVYDLNPNEGFEDAAVDESGYVYAIGQTSSIIESQSRDWDGLIAVYTPAGQRQWLALYDHGINAIGSDFLRGVVALPDSGLVVSGFSRLRVPYNPISQRELRAQSPQPEIAYVMALSGAEPRLISLSATGDIALAEAEVNNPAARAIRNIQSQDNGRPSPCGQLGDLNGDTLINSTDLLRGQRLSIDLEQPTETERARLDLDGDGRITPNDGVLLTQFVGGTLATFPACGQPAVGSSDPAPDVKFVISPARPQVGEVVYFSNSTTDLDQVAWQWDFGDGQFSTIQHPQYIYANPGLLTVSLTVTDQAGQTSSASQNLEIVSTGEPVILGNLQVALRAGWNMFGGAGQHFSIEHLRNSCNPLSLLWYDGAGYVPVTEVRESFGYWLKVASACQATIPQILTPRPTPPVELRSGWNLIGTVGAPVRINEIGGCEFVGRAYWYTGQEYEQTDILQPGRGYWVNVARACLAVLPTPFLPAPPNDNPPARPVEIDLTACNLEVYTKAGDEQICRYTLNPRSAATDVVVTLGDQSWRLGAPDGGPDAVASGEFVLTLTQVTDEKLTFRIGNSFNPFNRRSVEVSNTLGLSLTALDSGGLQLGQATGTVRLALGEAATTGALVVTVVNPDTLRGIAGISVGYKRCSGNTCAASFVSKNTDANGIVGFADLAPGDYVIEARQGEVKVAKRVTVVVGQAATLTLALRVPGAVATGNGAIIAAVVDERNNPVIGVNVKATPGNLSQLTIAPNGLAVFPGLTPRTYTLEVTHNDLTASQTIVVQPGQAANITLKLAKAAPDLIIKDVSWQPLAPRVGDTLTLNITFANQGKAVNETFNLLVKTEAGWSNQAIIYGLNAGQIATVTLTLNVTSAHAPNGPQDHEFVAIIDSDRAVTESVEDNNIKRFTINVKPGADSPAGGQALQDLWIKGLTALPNSPSTETKPTLTVTVASNAATLLSRPVPLEIRDENNRLVCSGEVPFPGLNSGTREAQGGCQATFALSASTHQLKAIIDDPNLIPELNESNNVSGLLEYVVQAGVTGGPNATSQVSLTCAKTPLSEAQEERGCEFTVAPRGQASLAQFFIDLIPAGQLAVSGGKTSNFSGNYRLRLIQIGANEIRLLPLAGGTAPISFPKRARYNVRLIVVDDQGAKVGQQDDFITLSQ